MLSPSFVKDPSAVLDYLFDWSLWLASGETIASASAVVSPSDGTLLVQGGAPTVNISGVVVWLTGGTLGQSYTLTCHITTSQARQDDRSMRIEIAQR